jgi:hypothetical protein
MVHELIFLLPYSANETWTETLLDALRKDGGGLIITRRFGIEMKGSMPSRQYQHSVDCNRSIQVGYCPRLAAIWLVHALLWCTKQHTIQVRRVPAYPCSLDHVLVLYQSVSIWLVDISLVEEATVNSKSEQTLVSVMRSYQHVHGHEVPLQWETKNYMQREQGFLCRPCHHGACCSLKVVASNLQVQEEPRKCSNICSLIGVSSNLEYKQ